MSASLRASLRAFEVHGWRWHNMSLKESMKRLAYMCERCNEEGTEEYDVKDIVKVRTKTKH